MRNRLIVLSGVPGSGKSTYCQAYKELYEVNNIKVNIVSSDEIRMELFGRYDSFESEKLVWEIFRRYQKGKEPVDAQDYRVCR